MASSPRSRRSARRSALRPLIGIGLALSALVPALWACTSHPLEKPEVDPEQQTNDYYVENPLRDVDLLFMIDDSGSTDNKQRNFTQNFPAFIQKLREIPGGLPNVHIGVVTSDMGAGGVMTTNMCMGMGDAAKFQVTDHTTGVNCGLNGADQFIVASNNGAMTNLQAGRTLEDVFTCMATRGSDGCGFEHQLKAIDVALNPRPTWNPMNANFLRPDAYLAIIMLTDEDDCSGPDADADIYTNSPPGWDLNSMCAFRGHLCGGKTPTGAGFRAPLSTCTANPNPMGLTPVSDFIDHVKALKPGHPEKIIAAAIAGWPAPNQEATAVYSISGGGGGRFGGGGDAQIDQVCTQAGGGTPGLREKAFLEGFQHHTLQTVCQANFSGALTNIADLVKAVVGNPCLSGPVRDIDMNTAGTQADCNVVDHPINGGDDVVLPNCDVANGATPCWSLVAAPECDASGFRVNIDRGGTPAPMDIQELVRCQTCTTANDPRCPKP